MTLPRRLRPTPEQRLRTLVKGALPGLAQGQSRSLRPVTHSSNPGIVLPDTVVSTAVLAYAWFADRTLPTLGSTSWTSDFAFTLNDSTGPAGDYFTADGGPVTIQQDAWYIVGASVASADLSTGDILTARWSGFPPGGSGRSGFGQYIRTAAEGSVVERSAAWVGPTVPEFLTARLTLQIEATCSTSTQVGDAGIFIAALSTAS